MGGYRRIVLTCSGALLALGTLSACGGGSEPAKPDATQSSSATSAATAFPPSATFVADMDKDGAAMTIGITVDGKNITAYACNGTDDEAWFFGEQNAGGIDITSRFRDTLTASFDGTDVEGDLTMDGTTYEFTAAPAEPPAGIYTAAAGTTRASWIVRPDGSSLGVQFTGDNDDLTVFEKQQLKQAEFREKVRNKRQLQRAERLERTQNGSMSSTINGTLVSPNRVNGSFRP
ncbi:hypothetical protein [Mycolicibacterium arseniciresistens]|uniref:Lipoprotein n=1 Tax=Mycolicibacterium arseniciresistens TaxID=3062257 RepID=A0ABT8UN27_9MYCO|nr:hypothetical protein [Mycolicibacterium arseniciresistens]MDO3639214.1 hypothetical protein [Mycolicibacterium arseniciresistens]